MIAGKNISQQNSIPQMNFRVRAGNSWSYTFDATYIDTNGNEQNYDFTDAELLCTLRGISEIKVQVVVSSNTVTLSLPCRATKNLKPQLMDWDLMLMEANGNCKTLMAGTFEVLRTVTLGERLLKKIYNLSFNTKLLITDILPDFLHFVFMFSSRISITTIKFVLRTMGLSFESRVNIWAYISRTFSLPFGIEVHIWKYIQKAFSFSFKTRIVVSEVVGRAYSHFFPSRVYLTTLLRKIVSNAFLSRINVISEITKGYVGGFSSRVTLTTL